MDLLIVFLILFSVWFTVEEMYGSQYNCAESDYSVNDSENKNRITELENKFEEVKIVGHRYSIYSFLVTVVAPLLIEVTTIDKLVFRYGLFACCIVVELVLFYKKLGIRCMCFELLQGILYYDKHNSIVTKELSGKKSGYYLTSKGLIALALVLACQPILTVFFNLSAKRFDVNKSFFVQILSATKVLSGYLHKVNWFSVLTCTSSLLVYFMGVAIVFIWVNSEYYPAITQLNLPAFSNSKGLSKIDSEKEVCLGIIEDVYLSLNPSELGILAKKYSMVVLRKFPVKCTRVRSLQMQRKQPGLTYYYYDLSVYGGNGTGLLWVTVQAEMELPIDKFITVVPASLVGRADYLNEHECLSITVSPGEDAKMIEDKVTVLLNREVDKAVRN